MAIRKLNRPSDQRRAILRNQVTALLWNGKLVTTAERAKEVRSIAEKLITIAVKDYDKILTVSKTVKNDKGVEETITVRNDAPEKLNARRRLMAYLYDQKELRGRDEKRADYKERTKDIRHPLIEKLFNEYAPKYEKRAQESGQGGGYTRMMKMGPRRGDAAEMVLIELV